MTLIITELVPSRSFTSSGGLTASRKFIGYEDEEDIEADPADIILAPGMPAYGQSHPDAPGLRAKEFTMTPSDDGTAVWEVIWDYEDFDPGDLQGSNPLSPPPTPIVFTRLDVAATVTLVDIWRDVSLISFPGGIVGGVNSPSQKSDGDGDAGYIVGKVLAWGGQAVTYAIPTATITITHDIDATELNAGPALDRVGKRNTFAWEGFPAGSVLFTGISLTRTAPFKYKITYNMSFDKWFHLRQIPQRNSDGTVWKNESDPDDVIYNIEWRQPFPLTVDFGFIPEV